MNQPDDTRYLYHSNRKCYFQKGEWDQLAHPIRKAVASIWLISALYLVSVPKTMILWSNLWGDKKVRGVKYGNIPNLIKGIECNKSKLLC